MGSSSGGQTTGFRYFMGLHFGICHGPIDLLRRIIVGDRVAWHGDQADTGQITINAPDLLGGDEREGGIVGDAHVLMGEQTQTLPSWVAALLPSPSPAFRGVMSLFYDGQISANNPYIKPFAFKAQRIFAGWHNDTTWYPEKAAIGELVAGADALTLLQSRFADGNANDESAYATGAPTQDGGTVVDGAFVVDNATSGTPVQEYLEYLDAGFQTNSGDLTFELFAEWEQTPNADYTTICEILTNVAVSSSFHRFGYIGDQGDLVYDDFSLSSGTVPAPSGFPSRSHLAIVFSATSLRAYVNGEKVFELSGDRRPIAAAMRVRIGDPVGFSSGRIAFRVAGFRVRQEEVYTGDSFEPPTSIPDPDGAQASTGNLLMNPAHIIYQCATDPVWGMGYPTSAIDEVSFTAAADTLFDEDFGLCMLWNKQEEIGTFIRHVLDHIGAVFYCDPKTGKFGLKLIRGDYDPDTLPVFDESNVVALESFQRVGYGDTVNEVTVVYRDVETNKDTPVTAQNLANIQAQGAVVTQTRQYPGLPNADLAMRVAQRDLIAVSTPLAKARLVLQRNAWTLFPGQTIKLNWPKLGIDHVVFRVLTVNYGTLEQGAIHAEIAEDVFGMPASSYADQEPLGWIEPDTSPDPVVLQSIIEAPYRSLVAAMTAAELAAVDEDAAYLCALAAKPSPSAMTYEVNSRVGSAAFEGRGPGAFVAYAELADDIGPTDTTIDLGNAVDLSIVATGTLAVIGSGQAAEMVRIDAVNLTATSVTVSRGMLDTVPAPQASGDVVFFDDGRSAPDRTERATGETVDFRLLTRATGGKLPISRATIMSATAAQRQHRPYPPGNVRINGDAYPASAEDALTITWAHRDRLQQTAGYIDQDDGNIGPEAGTTYSAELRNASNVVLASATGLTGTSWSPTVMQGGTYDATLRLWSVRGGLESWQVHQHTFSYTTAGLTIEAPGRTGAVTASLVFPAAGATITMALTQAAQAAKPATGWRSTMSFATLGGSSTVGEGTVLTAQFTRFYSVDGAPFAEATQAGIQLLASRTREQAMNDWASAANNNLTLRAYGWAIYLSGSEANPTAELVGPVGQEWDVFPTPPGTPPWSLIWGLQQSIADRGGPAILEDLPQIVTATLAGTPNPGDIYTVRLAGVDYAYTALPSDSLNDVAYGLALAIDAASAFSATSSDAVVTISGITPSNVFTYAAQASGARAYGELGADPHWSNVVLLLNTSGANDSTTFTDASTSAHSVTAVGDLKVTSNELWSDGAGDYGLIPSSSDFDFGSGDFTVEEISAVVNNPQTGPIALQAYWKTGGATLAWFFGVDNNNKLVFYYSLDGTSGVFSAFTSGTVSVGTTKQHKAVSRIGGTLRLFINGVKLYEGSHTGTIYAPSTTPLTIAGVDYASSSASTQMRLKHRTLRITKGVGRYSADFAPPTGPFPTY